MADGENTAKELPRIDIYKAWCKGCGICAAFCPAGVLGLDENGSPFVEHPEKCIACKWCEMRCPDFAITVTEAKKHEKKTGEKVGKER